MVAFLNIKHTRSKPVLPRTIYAVTALMSNRNYQKYFIGGLNEAFVGRSFLGSGLGPGAQATPARQIAALDVPQIQSQTEAVCGRSQLANATVYYRLLPIRALPQPVHNNGLSSVYWSPVLGTMQALRLL